MKDPIADAFGKITVKANRAVKKFSCKAGKGASKVYGINKMKKLKR